MTTSTVETTAIVASRLGELRNEIEKANRRLTKAGVAEQFKLIVGERYEHSWSDDLGFKHSETRVDVALEQPSLGYNGWTFVATLSFEQGGTVVRTVPGQTCDYRPSTKVCDQCHTDRYRTETFVVRNDETGEYKQVGRNCLALFFGLTPALWVFSYDPTNDYVAEGEHEGSSAGHRDSRVSLLDVVAAALAVSDEGRGYKPATFEGITTKGQVQDVLFATHGRDQEFNAWLDAARATTHTYRDNGLATTVIEHVRNLHGFSEYAENARVLARSEYVDVKNIGIVASFAKLWANEQGYAAERAAKAASQAKANEGKVNEYLGQVGDKLAVEGTVTAIRVIEGQYGSSRLVQILTTEGYTVKTFATAAWVWDVVEGDTVKITGTIKHLDEYHGQKATVLTRTKKV